MVDIRKPQLAAPTPNPLDGKAIVLVFTDDGNVSMQATPGVTAADYILGAFNLTRQANRILDGAIPHLVVPTPGAQT